jgi:hypothetical protein
MTEDPADALALLGARVGKVEEQAARQATAALAGLLGVLAVSMLLFAAAQLDAVRDRDRAALLIRACAVGEGRIPESQAAWCEQALAGYRLSRAPVAADAVAGDSLGRWASSGSPGPWVPPTTTTLYPQPPE